MIDLDNRNSRICLYCARHQGEEFKVRPLGISYLASFLLHKGLRSPKRICELLMTSMRPLISIQTFLVLVA